ncbi:patatin-like phospholipase family protein [Mycobacterium spongiae]|uniref:Cyclic nucleotide-binding domain-containing protein n=1 Tax=Mycobacterium spongiae TaxID=886343 RepID=A0A975K259_9MYCO|nr:cyclic nucleotide-binding domain-containing protein [Mycobacterium spongiae]
MSTRPRQPEQPAADKRAVLRRVPMLVGVADKQLDQLLTAIDRHHVPADEWLFHVGDPSDAIYIVDSGRFAAVGADGQIIRVMASGDSIGDLGVIAGAARSAGVRALRDGVVWKIAADTFTKVLARAPRLQSAMLQAMAGMLQESRSASISQRPRVIGVLSTGDTAAIPTADAIVTRLGSYGRAAVVAPPVDATAEVPSYAYLVEAFSEVLDRAERDNDWVLVVADRGSGDNWRRFVAAQGDRLVVLVDQPRPPDSFELVSQGPVHLVTCMVEADSIWWDVLAPVSHHRADDDGMGALARRIAGRSLGLVMAGGGVRGLAHLGVYEELTRAGIVIDRFGGTSIGAIAAAAFALGMNPEAAIAVALELTTQSNPLGDLAVPVVALTRGGRFDRLLEKLLGNSLIEHLEKEFFCISADLISGDQVIHRRGRVADAVRASISIPGLLPPVQRGDQILVDGALVNNLPADVMCADPDGEVICVDLRRRFEPSTGFDLLPSILRPPGFVRRVLTGADVGLPSLPETLLRSMDFSSGSRNLHEFPRVAAVIEPDVTEIGMLNFKQVEAAMDAGRTATRMALDAHPRLGC